MNTMLVSPTHGNFVFDAVFKTNHTTELETTSHPVQYGASITDHSFFQPEEVEFEFGFSDAMADVGVINHSVNAYSSLQEIMREREPLTLVTRLRRYDDMLIVQMSIPDEHAQMYGLKGSLKLKQIVIVEAAVVKVQTKISSSKGGSSSKAAVVTEESLTEVDNRSYLRILADEFGINLNLPGSNGKSATTSQGSFSSSNETIKGGGGTAMTGGGASRKKGG